MAIVSVCLIKLVWQRKHMYVVAWVYVDDGYHICWYTQLNVCADKTQLHAMEETTLN